MLKKRFISVLIAVMLVLTAITFIGGNTVSAAPGVNIFETYTSDDNSSSDTKDVVGSKAAVASETTDKSGDTKATATESGDKSGDTKATADDSEKAEPAEVKDSSSEADVSKDAGNAGDTKDSASEADVNKDAGNAGDAKDSASEADTAKDTEKAADEKDPASETEAYIIDLGSGEAVLEGDEADKVLETLTILMIDNKDIIVDNGLDLSADGKQDIELEVKSTDDGKTSLTLKKAESCTLEEDVTFTVSDDAKNRVKILKLNNYFETIKFQMVEPVQPEIASVFLGNKKQPFTTSAGVEKNLDTIWIYYSDMTFKQYVFLDDGMQVFSKGTYEFEKGDFNYAKTESHDCDITINRTQKYVDGEGLTEYESSHTYDLNTLGFEQIYVSQDIVDASREAATEAADTQKEATVDEAATTADASKEATSEVADIQKETTVDEAATTADASKEAATETADTQKETTADEAVPKLVILHTNDMHGYLEASSSCLGIDAVAQLKKDYQEKGINVLLFDAGDELQGNIFVNNSQGETAVTLMNSAGYDAMAVGNHEFDFGADVLEKRMAEFNFPVLAANITVDATGKPFAKENTTFTLKDGTKVGVFGLNTPSTKTASAPKNTAGLIIASDKEMYDVAQKQIDKLKEDGCTIIVCLGHLGESTIKDGNSASEVVANTRGLDVFIDGHDHEIEKQTVKDLDGREVLIAETGSYLKNIGVLSYDGSKFTEKLVEVGKYEGSDKEIKEKVETISKELKDSLSEKVATSSFELNGEEDPGNRTNETNMGDLFTDAVLWQVSQAADVKPDAAILNGGAFRAPIKAGDITLFDIHNVFPFNNQLCTIEVTGAQLLEALEAATQTTPESAGAFPQVSQIKYSVDTSVEYKRGDKYPDTTVYSPAEPGSRVTITEVGGKAFDKDATYTIATIDFIASGGDTYYCFAEAGAKTKQSVGYLDYEAITNYLADELSGTIPDTYKEAQGRITIK